MQANETKFNFVQDVDTNSSHAYHQLIVRYEQPGFITISTDRWALNEDELDDFINTLKKIVRNDTF